MNTVTQITGNKGEWSELYTLLKLLGEGRVYAGDANMNRLNIYYPVLSIIREDGADYTYTREIDNSIPGINNKVIAIKEDNYEVAIIPADRFIKEAKLLLDEIRKGGGNRKGAFPIAHAEQFMKEIYCTRLKAPSRDKADIRIMIHDMRTNMTPILGFSIKSQLGSPSTLLNAGNSTNIKFEVIGMRTDIEMDKINAIKDHLPRIDALYKSGFYLQYNDIEHNTFRNNLLFIDSSIPTIISECLIADSITGNPSIKSAVELVAKNNPLKFKGNCLKFYEHKMKQLLLAAALGMTPAKEWEGHFDANGGYLVVKSDGDIVCYHFHDQNQIEDYLYNNTRFERAARSRYGFGSVYREDDKYFLKLNLQIRFTK